MAYDLFGVEIPERTVFRGGYADQPGTGPVGETCSTCKYYAIKRMANAYRKCWLMHEHWTGGPGTDILASAPACSKWESGK